MHTVAGIMKAIGKVSEGDTVSIDFSAEGVVVSQNGEVRGKVAGANFAKALPQGATARRRSLGYRPIPDNKCAIGGALPPRRPWRSTPSC